MHPIEEIRLAATVEATGDGPIGFALETTGRWDDLDPDATPPRLRAAVAADGRVTLEVIGGETDAARVLDEATTAPIRPGRPRRFELWYADQHLVLFDGGKRRVEAKVDLDLDQLMRRAAPASRPEPAIAVGGPAVLREVELDRDLYYMDSGPPGDARGGLVRVRGTGRVKDNDPVVLRADQFFCIGDNSPASDDGRYWEKVHPWVRPVFEDPANAPPGIVPRELLIGRAFFVYFPSPHSFLGGSRGGVPIPNFGRMRFIH